MILGIVLDELERRDLSTALVTLCVGARHGHGHDHRARLTRRAHRTRDHHMTQNIRYSVDGDGIAILLIDVAGRPMNVLTPGFRKDLAECVDKVAADPAIKGAVIGSAKSSFMAGADIKDMVGAFERGTDRGARPSKFSGRAEQAAAPPRDLRQAVRGGDQRRRARRRLRGRARLPLPRDGGRPEGGRRLARGQDRPAARRRRHAAHAAPDRRYRGAATDQRGPAARRRRTRSRRDS